MMNNSGGLLSNIEKIHTTEMGAERIRKNLSLECDDVAAWCRRAVKSAGNISKKGKNWYVCRQDCIITINAGSYTIITAHKKKKEQLWQCPKCGREFKNTGQHHFCGKPATIDEYIAAQDKKIQPLLCKVRKCIRAAAPDAVEKMAWQMPTFWQGENLIHFAAFKNHLGIYPGSLENSPFTEKLDGYKTSKGAIQFPLDKPLDLDLISDIVRWRVQCAAGHKK